MLQTPFYITGSIILDLNFDDLRKEEIKREQRINEL